MSTVSVKITGSLAGQRREQAFIAHGADSSLADNLLYLRLHDFLKKIEKTRRIDAWGEAALKVAERSNMVETWVDTQSNRPAAKKRQPGLLEENQPLIEELAMTLHSAQVKRLTEQEFHSPATHSGDVLCSQCRLELLQWPFLGNTVKGDFRVMAAACLAMLSGKGLLP